MLVTTDGSEHSRRVLPHAAALATAIRAELTLLRVLDPLVDAADIVAPRLDEALERVRATWLTDLQQTIAAARVNAKPVVVTRRHGEDLGDSILRVATDLGVSLIAMDTQGHSAVKEVLFGSVALSVVGASSIPVMISGPAIEHVGKPHETYHIVVTTDCSVASQQIFLGLKPLTASPHIAVSIVHVCGPGMECRCDSGGPAACAEWLAVAANKLAPGRDTDVNIVEPGEDVSETIIARAVALGADVLAMSTHGHGAIRRMVAGSVALGVVKRSPLPVILQRVRP